MTSVAAAELDGRPVIISGSSDRTARVWDLTTGNPLASRTDTVQSLAVRSPRRSLWDDEHGQVAIGAGDAIRISSVVSSSVGSSEWKQIGALELSSNVLALAWADSKILVTGAELGIVVFDFPGH